VFQPLHQLIPKPAAFAFRFVGQGKPEAKSQKLKAKSQKPKAKSQKLKNKSRELIRPLLSLFDEPLYMEYYLPYLFWIGAIAASIVVILLLLSIIVGGDTDFDADVDSGGLGLIKSILIFIAVSAWTIRAVAMNSPMTWIYSVALGIMAGLLAVFLMSAALRFLWSRQESGNWLMQQTQGEEGYVYVPIPDEGIGRVMISMHGKEREIDAISENGHALPYKEKIQVVDYNKEYVVVRPLLKIQTQPYEETV